MLKVIVYGVGNNGKTFVKDVMETYEDIRIVAVMDSYAGESGLPVRMATTQEVCHEEFDYIVITPTKYQEEIRERLLMGGIPEKKLISMGRAKKKFAGLRCNLCGGKVWAWGPCGFEQDVFKEKKIVGASVRRGLCPICGSTDRERFVYHVIKEYTGLLEGEQKDVLHFAPEKMLSGKIRAVCGSKYISADIEEGTADIVADITGLSFSDGSFDYVICNHVMEHVRSEEKAFLEIKRCLKPGGTLVFTVPICWEQATAEGIDGCEEDRVKYYGQKDHVRLYGNDIVRRIEQYGFHVRMLRCNEIMEGNQAKRMGYIYEDSVLLCVPGTL